MQWADDSLLDFIEYLLDSSRSSPILVLTLARPELHERRPTWGAGRRNFTSLYLEPLPATRWRSCSTGSSPACPRRCAARSSPAPRASRSTPSRRCGCCSTAELLVQEGAVYRPAAPIDALEVPETLHALIAARLDGLPPEERRVLQDAAVLGKTFTKRALAALSGLTEAELEPLLASLVRKEVLAVQADPRSPEHGQYGFLQDLVRHVAYETLSKRERTRAPPRRRLAPRARASRDEEEIVEVLASHYLDAYREVPDAEDAGEIKAKAREMLGAPGSARPRSRRPREAQRYFQQAAELTDEPLVRAELDEKAGRMAWRRGRVDEAVALLGEALGRPRAGRAQAPGGADRRRPRRDRLPRGRQSSGDRPARTRARRTWATRSRTPTSPRPPPSSDAS